MRAIAEQHEEQHDEEEDEEEKAARQKRDLEHAVQLQMLRTRRP